jgi:hypothetical protein
MVYRSLDLEEGRDQHEPILAHRVKTLLGKTSEGKNCRISIH